MKLIEHFSYNILAIAIKAISISRGCPDRLELLYFLLDRGIYRPQIVEEALCHITHFMIDHESSELIKIALTCVRVLEQKKQAKRVLRLVDTLETYVEWYKTREMYGSFYKIDEDGVEFYSPEPVKN